MDRSVGRVMAVIHRVGRTWAEASSIAGRTARLDRARTGGFGGRRSERHPAARTCASDLFCFMDHDVRGAAHQDQVNRPPRTISRARWGGDARPTWPRA